MRRLPKLLPIAWLMLLLLLPAVAYLVGERQPELENRAKTAFPDINRGTLRQEHTFQQIDAALRERLPLRRYAVDARGRIAIRLFGDSPTKDVLLGEDGWLYYRPELRVCEPDGQPKAPPANAVGFVTRMIAASGRQPVVIVAGSKIVTHDEHLKGVDAEALSCVAAVEASVHDRLEELPGGYPVQAELDALEARGIATFLRSDTHWNSRGREVFARTVLDAVQPGLAAEARLRRLGEVERDGDLGTFIGQKRTDRDRMLTVTGTPKADFAPGELLFVGDSQFGSAMQIAGADGATVLDRVFPGQPVCDWNQVSLDGCSPALLAAKTIVIETVARNLDLFVDTCWRTVSTLADTVQGRPARWAGAGGGSTQLTVSPTAAPVRVAFADDRTDVPRLIRIPIRALPADPAADPAAGPADPPQVAAVPSEERACARTTASDPSALVIPVRADERISDVELQVSGPAGAELGRPEVLVLDNEPLPAR